MRVTVVCFVCLLPSLLLHTSIIWCKSGVISCADQPTCTCTCMYCVDFVENALFKSGDICLPPLPSLLLSADKRDSNGFFLRKPVCRTSDSFYNSTGSSLIMLLGLCTKTADQAYTCKIMMHIMCNHIMHSCGYSASLVLVHIMTCLQLHNSYLDTVRLW